eukprot:2671727-Alexandrium_andersonii.AAC.1
MRSRRWRRELPRALGGLQSRRPLLGGGAAGGSRLPGVRHGMTGTAGADGATSGRTAGGRTGAETSAG